MSKCLQNVCHYWYGNVVILMKCSSQVVTLLSFWQLSVQPVAKISSRWHFRFCDLTEASIYQSGSIYASSENTATIFLLHICPLEWRNISTETKMSSLWRNFNHWLHWKLSFWQLPVQPVMKISSKWRHFRFSECRCVLNHRQFGCLLNSLFMLTTDKYQSSILALSEGGPQVTRHLRTITSYSLPMCAVHECRVRLAAVDEVWT